MKISKNLASQFAKITKDTNKQKEETLYGTITTQGDKLYVVLDGSESLTPVVTTTEINTGERVAVMIKSHTATIIGNITNPGTGKETTKQIQNDISDMNITITDKVSTKELETELAIIDEAIIGKATVEELYAVKAEIDEAIIGKANIADLTAINATISALEANYADIDTLIGGHLTMDNIQSLILTTSKVTVEDAFIKDAMIDSVSANKLTAGSINTSFIQISSEDESLLINGSTQQFKDSNGNIRIQIGKDASGDFTFILYGEDGQGQILNQNGITASAISDGLIIDKMVSDNANISGGKIDITSLITEINENDSTINSSRILFDDTGQTLNVAFNTLRETVDNIVDVSEGDLSSVITRIESLETDLNVTQGEIDTLISYSVIETEDGQVVLLKDDYSTTKQTLDEMSVKIGSLETTTTDVTSRQTALEQNLEGFKLNVSETYSTKDEAESNMDAANEYTDSQVSIAKAEIKITTDSITNTISNNYYTKDETEDSIESKGFATTSEVIQTVDSLELKFQQSGGYNLLYNGNFKRGLDKWTLTPDFIVTYGNGTYSSPDCCGVSIEGQSTDIGYIYQDISSDYYNYSTYTLTGYINISSSGVNYATDMPLDTLVIYGQEITQISLENCTISKTLDSFMLTSYSASNAVVSFNVTNLDPNETYTFSTDATPNISFEIYYGEGQYQYSPTGQDLSLQGYSSYTFVFYSISGTSSNWSVNGIKLTDSSGHSNTPIYDDSSDNFHYYALLSYDDGTTIYHRCEWDKTIYDEWQYVKLTFDRDVSKNLTQLRVAMYADRTTKKMYLSQAMIEGGSTSKGWTPNPNEVSDGVITIDKDGITVDSSNSNTNTSMTADGFKITNTTSNQDIFNVNSDGTLTMYGTVNTQDSSNNTAKLTGDGITFLSSDMEAGKISYDSSGAGTETEATNRLWIRTLNNYAMKIEAANGLSIDSGGSNTYFTGNAVNVTNSLGVGSNLTVSGTGTISGNVTIGGGLSVTNNISGASIAATGNITGQGSITLNRASMTFPAVSSTATADRLRLANTVIAAASNSIHFVTSSATNATVYGGAFYGSGYNNLSDKRAKTDIKYVIKNGQEDIEPGEDEAKLTTMQMLKFIEDLPLASYKLNEELNNGIDKTHYGIIIQDIEGDDVGEAMIIRDNPDAFMKYSVDELLIFLCGATQQAVFERKELQKQIEELKEQQNSIINEEINK